MSSLQVTSVILGVAVVIAIGVFTLTDLPLLLRTQVPPALPSSVSKQFSWTPAANTPPGPRTLTLVADDGRGGLTTKNITVTVAGQTGGSSPGDLNSDGVVNIDDIAIVTSNFGLTSSDSNFDDRADPTQDGVVNIEDITVVIANFGSSSGG